MTRLRNYLRFHRRKSALTQKELAFLLGYENHSAVSRSESAEQKIDLGPAFAYQLLFDVELSDLFPALYKQVQQGLVPRVHALQARIKASKSSQITAAKLKLLREALMRLAEAATQSYGSEVL